MSRLSGRNSCPGGRKCLKRSKFTNAVSSPASFWLAFVPKESKIKHKGSSNKCWVPAGAEVWGIPQTGAQQQRGRCAPVPSSSLSPLVPFSMDAWSLLEGSRAGGGNSAEQYSPVSSYYRILLNLPSCFDWFQNGSFDSHLIILLFYRARRAFLDSVVPEYQC